MQTTFIVPMRTRKTASAFSVNRPFVLVLLLVLDWMAWLRGRGRGRRRARGRTGSWSQCMRRSEMALSVNRAKSRQVLDCARPLALFDLVCGRKSGRGLPQSKTLSRQRTHVRGSSSQCMRKNERGLSVNRPKGRQVLDCASPLALFDRVWGCKSGSGLPQSKTLSRRRTHLRGSRSQCMPKNEKGRCPWPTRFWTAPVLWRFSIGFGGAKAAVDCRSPRRYRDGAPTSVVHGPNACRKTKRGVVHGPPGFGLRQSSGAFRSGLGVQKRQWTAAVQDAIATAHPPPWFTVPKHAEKRQGTLSMAHQVLDCASPLALFDRVRGRKSGSGLPQSKTLSRRRTHLRGSYRFEFGDRIPLARKFHSAATRQGLESAPDRPGRPAFGCPNIPMRFDAAQQVLVALAVEVAPPGVALIVCLAAGVHLVDWRARTAATRAAPTAVDAGNSGECPGTRRHGLGIVDVHRDLQF